MSDEAVGVPKDDASLPPPPDCHARLDAVEARLDEHDRRLSSFEETFRTTLLNVTNAVQRQLGEQAKSFKTMQRAFDELRRTIGNGKKNVKH